MTTTDTTAADGTELVDVDPNSLVIGDNVRDDADLAAVPEFVESIRERGVLHPILARRDKDGTLIVTDGQMRTLAAIAAGRDRVPVYVTGSASTTNKAQAARIIDQLTSNDRRTDLTERHRAKAAAQLSLLGTSDTAIGKALGGIKREAAKAYATVGRSDRAEDLLNRDLTLEQAAIVAEYETEGDTDAVDRLLGRGWHQFEYVHQLIENERAERVARAEIAKSYADKGITVLEDEPDTQTAVMLEDLRITDADDVEAPPAETIVDEHPHLFGVWLDSRDAIVWREDGEDHRAGDEVDETTVDWAVEDEPDTAAEDGRIHPKDVAEALVWDATYYALTSDDDTLAAAGVYVRAVTRAILDAAAARAAGTEPATTEADPNVDAEKARKEAEAAESERQWRRTVVKANKALDAANTVRREWLTKWLKGRKNAPKGTAVFVTAVVARDPEILTHSKARSTRDELLGIGTGDRALVNARWLDYDADKESDARSLVLLFATVAGGIEGRVSKEVWRYRDSVVKPYLDHLSTLGYEPTPIERVAAGDTSIDDIDLD